MVIRRYLSSRSLLVIILIGFVSVQCLNLFIKNIDQLISIRKNIGQPAVWRGANSFGQDFANLIAFLHEEIPEDARVIIPPRQLGPYALTSTQFMQYFLFPRTIINCNEDYENCIKSFSGSTNTYIVVVNSEHISDLATIQSSPRFRAYNSKYGVFAPEEAVSISGKPLVLYPALEFVAKDLFGALFFLIGLWFAGGLFLTTWFPKLNSLETVGYGFGLASGTFSLFLVVPLMNGGQMSKTWVLGLYFFLLAFSSLSYFFNRHNREEVFRLKVFVKNETWLLPILFMGVILIILAFGLGYHHGDALGIWAPKGYGIALAGFPDGPTHWGTLPTKYPLNIPMLIASMRVIFSENLPESKLIFPFFSTALLIVIFAFFRQKLPGITTALAVLVLGTSQLFFSHSFIAYANLATAYFFISGVFLIENDSSLGNPQGRYKFLGSVFLALAAWTRPEVLPIAIIAIIILIGFQKGSLIKRILVLGSPMAIYSVFWAILKPIAYSKNNFIINIYKDSFLEIIQGKLNLDEAEFIIKYFLSSIVSFDIWGMVGWSLILGVLGFIIMKPKYKILLDPKILIAILYILAIMGGYYFISFTTSQEYPMKWWLGTGFNRMVMPGLILLWASLIRTILHSINSLSQATYPIENIVNGA